MAAITSSNYRNPATGDIQSGYNPSGYSPALPPYIDSVSGSVSQGSTMTIAAVNASFETSGATEGYAELDPIVQRAASDFEIRLAEQESKLALCLAYARGVSQDGK